MQAEPSPEMWSTVGAVITDAGIATEDGAVINTEDGQNIQAE